MPLATLLLALTLTPGSDNVVYRDTRLGLQFEYPKTWKVRKEKQYAIFEIPLEGGLKASVQLFSAKFKDSADNWQLIQVEINKSLRRSVERQWQEEILGVPMLLTKIAYEDKGQSTVSIIGLLYTDFEQKMNFRLTAPANGADQAESSWWNAMLTLRTTTGDLPNQEDPNKPSVKPTEPPPTKVWTATSKPKKPERGPVAANLPVGQTTFVLHLPKGWTLDGDTLKHGGFSGTVHVTAVVGLADEAASVLSQSALDALSGFDRVILREDKTPHGAASGANVASVFRVGTSKGADRIMGDAVGVCEGVYWHLSYLGTDAKAYARDRALLSDLYEFLYAEKA